MHRSSSMSDALKQQELQTKPKSLTFYGWVIFGRQIFNLNFIATQGDLKKLNRFKFQGAQ